MTYFLYILKSLGFPRYYIGISDNLTKRVQEHNRGSVRSTKAYRPWKLVHTEGHLEKKGARKKEIHLKNNYQARKKIFNKV